jgi:hypothetical protein
VCKRLYLAAQLVLLLLLVLVLLVVLLEGVVNREMRTPPPAQLYQSLGTRRFTAS